MRLALLPAALVFTLAIALLSVSSAIAYPVPSGLEGERYAALCPPRPAEYTGTEGKEALLTELEQSQSDACVRHEQQYVAEQGVVTALHGDLWILAGILVGAFVGSEVLRKVWP